jgi:hypothetical protein
MDKKFIISQRLITNPSFPQQQNKLFPDNVVPLPYKPSGSIISNPSFPDGSGGPIPQPKYETLPEIIKKQLEADPPKPEDDYKVTFDKNLEYEQDAKKAFQLKSRQLKQQADYLKNLNSYKDFTKTLLEKQHFEENLYAVQLEINRLEKEAPRTQKEIIDYNKRKVSLPEYISRLKNQEVVLNSKLAYEELEASSSVTGSAGRPLGVKPGADSGQWQGRRDLESLERLIRQRQENIADLEGYIFGLVTGTDEFTPYAPNVAHTNAKFVKTAEELIKEADEVIEDYYNELYDGDPNFGTALEHFEENRNKSTEDITKHSSNKKFYKFRKK